MYIKNKHPATATLLHNIKEKINITHVYGFPSVFLKKPRPIRIT